MVATDGNKHAPIKDHFKRNIETRYRDMDTSYKPWPATGVKDRDAWRAAIDELKPGDAITIFTPDSTHFPIAAYALQKKIHVLVTKPAVQKLEEHLELLKIAKEASKGDQQVLCYVEHHKRFDPAYLDAKEKAASGQLGFPSFFQSYMSQPKTQLETFKAWAGVDSDISYYLNSHHVDVFAWMAKGQARPVKVTASASSGIAESLGCKPGTEDTITLLVDWEILPQGSDSEAQPVPGQRATSVFTASWSAPKGAGVHSEQGFHYVGSKGEARVNQSRRGYEVTTEEGADPGYKSLNPFYVQYAPLDGYFQPHGYGVRSIEIFVQACTAINSGKRRASEYDDFLPTLADTVSTTAILHAGRISLDEKRSVGIQTGSDGLPTLV